MTSRARTPDSRASAGQQIEDELDAISDEMRRRTRAWIAKSRRPNPRSVPMHTAILGGIAGGLLDELWEMAQGDVERFRAGWITFCDGYIGAVQEDEAANREEGHDDQDS